MHTWWRERKNIIYDEHINLTTAINSCCRNQSTEDGNITIPSTYHSEWLKKVLVFLQIFSLIYYFIQFVGFFCCCLEIIWKKFSRAVRMSQILILVLLFNWLSNRYFFSRQTRMIAPLKILSIHRKTQGYCLLGAYILLYRSCYFSAYLCNIETT